MPFCCYCCLVAVMSNSFATPWTVGHQDPLYVGFPRQECWSRLPSPSLGGLPDPRLKPTSPALAGGFFTTEPPAELRICHGYKYFNAIEWSLRKAQMQSDILYSCIHVKLLSVCSDTGTA